MTPKCRVAGHSDRAIRRGLAGARFRVAQSARASEAADAVRTADAPWTDVSSLQLANMQGERKVLAGADVVLIGTPLAAGLPQVLCLGGSVAAHYQPGGGLF